nr:MAG TPA: hypothetical protein [Caudoviricetes sp.]
MQPICGLTLRQFNHIKYGRRFFRMYLRKFRC